MHACFINQIKSFLALIKQPAINISKDFTVAEKWFFFIPIQRSEDTFVLLTKNKIKAVKKLVFFVVWKTKQIAKVNDADFEALILFL